MLLPSIAVDDVIINCGCFCWLHRRWWGTASLLLRRLGFTMIVASSNIDIGGELSHYIGAVVVGVGGWGLGRLLLHGDGSRQH